MAKAKDQNKKKYASRKNVGKKSADNTARSPFNIISWKELLAILVFIAAAIGSEIGAAKESGILVITNESLPYGLQNAGAQNQWLNLKYALVGAVVGMVIFVVIYLVGDLIRKK